MVNIYEAGPFEGRAEQWPVLAISGALEVRLAETDHEVELAQRLRYSVFYEEMTAIPSPRPMNPIPSLVFALRLTDPGRAPSFSASRVAIAPR